MATLRNIIGQKFNRLLVTNFIKMDKGHSFWECVCECDNKTIVRRTSLITGDIKSCGCLKEEQNPGIVAKFRQGTKIQRHFYQVWAGMKARCTNKNHVSYLDYGGRGIKVCDSWLNFNNFIEDTWSEYKQRVENNEKISLDRYPDVNGNYEPGNIRWATDSQQARGKRNSSKSENYEEHNYWRSTLISTISRAIRKTKGIYKSRKNTMFEFYVGLSVLDFKKYIESQFESWMTWNNYGHGKGKWSLDHIKQCHEFDLSQEQDRRICFYYTNYRPYDDTKNNIEQNRKPITI